MKVQATLIAILLGASVPARADDRADVAGITASLSVRHDPPPCTALLEGVAHPVPVLTTVVDRVTMPPWVPVRAARCLIELPEADASVRAWLRDPSRPGLAEIVLGSLDRLPEDRAVALAGLALSGPHGARARVRLAMSTRPSLRHLVSP